MLRRGAGARGSQLPATAARFLRRPLPAARGENGRELGTCLLGVEGGRLFKVRQKEASAWEPGGLDPGREWNGVGAAASAVPPAPARPPGLSAPSPRAPSSLAPAAPAAASSPLSPPPLPLASPPPPPPLPPSPPPLLPPPLSPPPPPQPPPTSPPPPFPPGHPGPCRVPERRRLRCGPLDPEPAEPELGGQTDTLMHRFLAPGAMLLLPPAGAGQGSWNRPGSTRGQAFCCFWVQWRELNCISYNLISTPKLLISIVASCYKRRPHLFTCTCHVLRQKRQAKPLALRSMLESNSWGC
ncbi:WAS/WASL-interacting protein family member 3-like [Mesoplodon densirostris]|uniref:WAS/WASL-interacting protein family member 3-like n=1 Tax=Mesoplodon densirostris TaxID=48708 RepID=UPI0028DB092F|nr:WAS/WASL-interacting protein family member 3-like [Mesoplodon densirostris]